MFGLMHVNSYVNWTNKQFLNYNMNRISSLFTIRCKTDLGDTCYGRTTIFEVPNA